MKKTFFLFLINFCELCLGNGMIQLIDKSISTQKQLNIQDEDQEKYKELIFYNDIISPQNASFLFTMYHKNLEAIIKIQQFAEDVIYQHPDQESRELGKKIQNSLPHRILLIGPPGMKKTLLARYIACTSRINRYYLTPSWFQYDLKNGIPLIYKLMKAYGMHGSSAAFVIDNVDRLDEVADHQMLKLLYELLEYNKENKNILIIATANDINNISKDLKRYFTANFEIEKPKDKRLLEILNFYLGNIPLTNEQENWFINKMEGLCLNDIEKILHFAFFIAKEENEKSTIVNFEHIKKGIVFYESL